MTNSPSGGLGSQRPRVEHVAKAAFSDLGEDAVALCKAAGLHLDDWQAYVVQRMLGERLDRRFVAKRVGVVVPRQQGKGVILEARALAGLFLMQEPYIIWTAHELKTAQAAFLRLRGWIDGCPDLAKHVEKYYTGNTENSIILKDGRALRFLARTHGSGRGLTASTLILDEAYALTQGQLAALMPTLSTADNPQTIFTSSAGMPSSEVLGDLREEGLRGTSSGLAYFEWSAEDDASPDDLDALATANPGLGVRLSLDHVATERASMDDETFKRERLGIWAKLGGDSAITEQQWDACADPDVRPGDRVVFSVDVPPTRDSASIVAVSDLPDGRRLVDVIERREGVAWVAARLRELQVKWSPVDTILDEGSAAGALVNDFRRERVRWRAIGFRQYGAACGEVFDAVQAKQLVHTGVQGALREAVLGAKTKGMGESLWKWARVSQVVDISPLKAVSQAWWGLSRRERAAAVPDAERSSRIAGRRPVGRAVVGRGRGGGRG